MAESDRLGRCSRVFQLSGDGIDEIAGEAERFLNRLGMERANIVRIRLSLEDGLLAWREHFGESRHLVFSHGVFLGLPFLKLELRGERADPFSSPGNMFGSSLLLGIGLTPRYSYRNGVNQLMLVLKPQRLNPALVYLYSIVAGVFFGVLGDLFLEESIKATLILTFLDPVRDLFYRILNIAGGPIVFISVLTAVCGVGGAAAVGEVGRKRFVSRCLYLTLGMTALAAWITSEILNLDYLYREMDTSQASMLLDYMFQIFPNDLLLPFIEGNSNQIILVAFLIGNAIVISGTRAGTDGTAMDQLFSVMQTVTEWVTALSPYFLAVLLVLGIWDNTFHPLVGLWKPLLIFAAVMLAFAAAAVLSVSLRFRVPPGLLVGKMRESFLVAFRTASVDASYGLNRNCCERKLGIAGPYLDYGLPVGLVIYMPASSVAALILTLYCAECYKVPTSFVWYVMAIVLNVTLSAAAPPIAGASLWSYIAVFMELEIPRGALTIVILGDVLAGFLVAALNQAMLQLELTVGAKEMGFLREEILRKEIS